MDDTYTSLQDQGSEMERCQGKLAVAAGSLAAGAGLLQQLVRYRFNLTPAELEVLRSHLTAEVLAPCMEPPLKSADTGSCKSSTHAPSSHHG
jgi:hypothetical protein